MVCICIGPVCIPVYAILPLLWALFLRFKNRVVAWWKGEKTSNDDSACCQNGVCELKQPLNASSSSPESSHGGQVGSSKWSTSTKEVRHVASEQEWRELAKESKEGDKLLVVKFTATWCQPCKQIAPKYKEMCQERYESESDKTMFVEVDVDELDQVMAECGVSAMPTFQIYRNGSCVGKCLGADEVKLRDLIEEHCSM